MIAKDFKLIVLLTVISHSCVLGKPTCKYDEFITEDMFGNKSCVACPKCQVGFGLTPQCGSIINYGDRFKCEPCQLGVSYSTKNDISSCKPCGICTNHMTTISKCTPTRNSKCGKSCERGFYYSQVTFDCQECSWCCKESDSSPIKACKVPGVPFYKQCSADDGLFCQPRCTDKQFVVVNKALNRTCLECPNCPKGKGLQPKCSSVLTNQNEAKCSTCIPSKTFSDVVDPSSCKPCSACEVGKKIERVCNTTHDTLCGDCTHGFYNEKQADGKINCKECSFCCGDKLDVRVDECKAQGIPTDQQCAYTERAVRKCKHSQSEPPYNLIIILSVLGFAIAMAVVIVGLYCYHFKIRRINYKRLVQVESCESMIGVTPLVEKEGPSPNSTPDLITFTKSGVKIKCADPDVDKSILDMVSVEVCTGTSNSNLFPKLKENEVLLSPVIKLHNGGYNLHHPVRLNLFHTAVVEREEIENWSITVLKSNKSDENYYSSEWTNLTDLKDIVVEKRWVEFSENDFTSYVTVGMPGQDKKLSKKRMRCAVFGNSEPRLGIPYSINLYLIDDCEPTYQKLIVEEENQGRKPMASPRSLHPDIHPNSKITVSIEVASEGWTTRYQPKTFHSRDWLESYKKIPKVEAIFEHQDQFQNDFKCSFIIQLNDATVVKLPLMQYFASYCSQATAGGIQESPNTSQDNQEHEAANRATGSTSFTDDEINKALQSIDIDKLNAFTHMLFPGITDDQIELMKTSADPMVSLSDMVKRQKITCKEINSAVKHCQGNNQSAEDIQLPYLGETNPVVI